MSNNFLALDLELDQPQNEVIQVGTCVIDLDTGSILDKKGWFIKIDHPLNPFITDLTGITDEELATQGVTYLEMYEGLKEFHAKYSCAVNPITWGGGDHRALKKAIGLGEDESWILGRREVDAKTVFQSWRRALGQPVQGGLARSMTKLGLAFQGRKHNAIDDSVNTARIYYALLKKFRA